MAMRIFRPAGAHKLLTYLLYSSADTASYEAGKAPLIVSVREKGVMPYLEIPSIRRLARALGTESKRINAWIIWLLERDYLLNVAWTEDRRSCKIRIRRPSNI